MFTGGLNHAHKGGVDKKPKEVMISEAFAR